MRNSQLIWGMILFLLGGLMLAGELGVRLPNGIPPINLFWPLILISGGIWVLTGISGRGKAAVESASIDLQGASQVSLYLSHGAGELNIRSGAGGLDFLRGTFVGGLDRKNTLVGERLDVRLKPARDLLAFPFPGPLTRLDWDLAINKDVPLSLVLKLGANRSKIDLHDMTIRDIKLDTGASDTRIILPEAGRFTADLDLGAASLEIIIPEGVAARIRTSIGVAELKIDQTRFPYSNGCYQSLDFDNSPNAVDMKIDAGAASIKVF